MSHDAKPWQDQGARATTRARHPNQFVEQHIAPLTYQTTLGVPAGRHAEVTSEEQFWRNSSKMMFGTVALRGFRLTDWFPRTPGVYWSERAEDARKMVWSGPDHSDPQLGRYYSPEGKLSLIEEGGIGTIRLRPRAIDGERCWLSTALSGVECHCGIPLAIPDTILQQSHVQWGDNVFIEGHVRFLQEAGLQEVAEYVHHARPLIVIVETLRGDVARRRAPMIITPVALFGAFGSDVSGDQRPGYTFVQCQAGSEREIDEAADWIEAYAAKYRGQVITNFDEQRPNLADAPLSYQRLVKRTHDRVVMENITGPVYVEHVERVFNSVSAYQVENIDMSQNISVGGSAIINIDSTLNNVTQTIANADGLDQTQQSRLASLVDSLRSDLQRIASSHPAEASEIAQALDKAVTNASKPASERKRSILQLSANGLKEAAGLVKDIVPTLVATADLIARFIVGLS